MLWAEFNVSIVHQGPVRKKPGTQGNPDTADMLAIRVLQAAVMESFFVSVVKSEDVGLSVKESALYGKFTSLAAQKSSNQSVLVMGLAATSNSASLWLYMMARWLRVGNNFWTLCPWTVPYWPPCRAESMSGTSVAV